MNPLEKRNYAKDYYRKNRYDILEKRKEHYRKKIMKMKIDTTAEKEFLAKPKRTDNMKKYLRDYHQEYRTKSDVNRDYYRVLHLLNSIIRKGNRSDYLEWELGQHTCCSIDFLLDHLGLTNEFVLNAFKSGDYEIDHLLPKKWFAQNSEYEQWANHWRNLRVVSKQLNRDKGSDVENSTEVLMFKVTLFREVKFAKMESELFQLIPNHFDRARILRKIYNDDPIKIDLGITGNNYDGYFDSKGNRV
jgi:hypothetical protein